MLQHVFDHSVRIKQITADFHNNFIQKAQSLELVGIKVEYKLK